MRINQNISAMNTYSRLTAANNAKSNSLAKLSSGLRINKAGDDAAGLAISEKMRGQVSGLNQAAKNAQDGISLIQTAEGALNEAHSILQRMRELAVQSANDTNTAEDRGNIQDEMDQLATELTRISTDTQFNGQRLLEDGFSATFHIGANRGQNMSIELRSMDAASLGVGGTSTTSAIKSDGTELTAPTLDLTTPLKAGKYTVVDLTKQAESYGSYEVGLADANGDIVAVGKGTSDNKLASIDTWLDVKDTSKTLATFTAGEIDEDTVINVQGKGINVESQGDANNAIDTIDIAIKAVSEERSKLGATQNRLDHTINNLTTTSENLSAAESRIRDVDMAQEMMEFTKNNILSQAATSMLAQANQMPQSVLQLLQ